MSGCAVSVSLSNLRRIGVDLRLRVFSTPIPVGINICRRVRAGLVGHVPEVLDPGAAAVAEIRVRKVDAAIYDAHHYSLAAVGPGQVRSLMHVVDPRIRESGIVGAVPDHGYFDRFYGRRRRQTLQFPHGYAGGDDVSDASVEARTGRHQGGRARGILQLDEDVHHQPVRRIRLDRHSSQVKRRHAGLSSRPRRPDKNSCRGIQLHHPRLRNGGRADHL